MNNMQIAEAIRLSASQYNDPDETLGYGIPDFVMANNILTIITGPESNDGMVAVYPNPVAGSFTIDAGNLVSGGAMDSEMNIEILDITGKVIGKQDLNLSGSSRFVIDLLQNKANGMYFMKVTSRGQNSVIKLVKE